MTTFRKGHSARPALIRNRRQISRIEVLPTRPERTQPLDLNPAIPRDAIILTLIRRDGDHCYLCRRRPDGYDIEHIIPRSRGGTDDLWNLALACPFCNSRKGVHIVSILVKDRSPVYHLAR